MDHLATSTKFHDQAATIILVLLYIYQYKCTISCAILIIYISTVDAVRMTTKTYCN